MASSSFVDVRALAVSSKWESVVEGLLPRRLLQRKSMATPWRSASSPLVLAHGAYGLLRRSAPSWPLFVLVFSTLACLASLPCLLEVFRFLYVCSCVKSSLESSRSIFAAVAQGGAAGRRRLCRDLALQALSALACNLAVPRRACEVLLTTHVLLEASGRFCRRREKRIASSIKAMGSAVGSYLVASPRAASTQLPGVPFEEEACCVLTPTEAVHLQILSFEEEEELQEAPAQREMSSHSCDAPRLAGPEPDEEEPARESQPPSPRKLRRLVRIDDLDAVALGKPGPLVVETPLLNARAASAGLRESILRLEDFIE
jgi:hypothetical protein